MKSRSTAYSLFLVLLLGIASVASAARGEQAAAPDNRIQELLENDGFVYLPLIIRLEQQIVPAAQPILNGDFEEGPVHWRQYSEKGWSLILTADYLPVLPHSGIWAVWLGGDNDEINGIWQKVTVPVHNPKLSFYYWIASEDLCGYDASIIVVNLEVVVAYAWLCAENNTDGWARTSFDFSAYAGQTIELDIVVGTDEIAESHLFIDDVSLDGSAAANTILDDGNIDTTFFENRMSTSTNRAHRLDSAYQDRANSLSKMLQKFRVDSFEAGTRNFAYEPVDWTIRSSE